MPKHLPLKSPAVGPVNALPHPLFPAGHLSSLPTLALTASGPSAGSQDHLGCLRLQFSLHRSLQPGGIWPFPNSCKPGQLLDSAWGVG